MTAEIAILNRSAMAMAADSAVTIGAQKKNGKERVWKTTNKLFSLSPENDIGIMIYGTGDFCGVPWETIIKLFSQQKNRRYGTVEECKNAFVDFVKSFPAHDPETEELNTYFLLLNAVEGLVSKAKQGQSKTESKALVNGKLAEFESFLDDVADSVVGVDYADFEDTYSELVIDALCDEVGFKPPQAMKRRLVEVCHRIFDARIPSGFETGLVFGGFGQDEFFPCISNIVVDGRSAFGTRYWDTSASINMDRWKESSAYIQAFAQRDIAHLFIEGVEEGYLEFMEATILGALGKKSRDVVKSYVPDKEKVVELELQRKQDEAALESIMKDFHELRRRSIVDPMLSVVRNLPKEEMAAMAESLVEITSLRRQMDSDVESVAGPVDVVVISKGDGLVWMKRKHYFDAEKNLDFALRRSARRNGG